MKDVQPDSFSFPRRNTTRNPSGNFRWAVAVFWFLIFSCSLRAGTLYVPNFSFETPVTEFVETNIDSWQDRPQSPFYDPVEFGGNPWDTLMGIFANTSPTNDDYLENLNGNQAAYVFNFPGAGFFQDCNSTDWSNTVPTHAFNSKFEAGRSYHLTTGFASSFDEPLSPGASIEMSLYYRDVSNNIVTVAATNIIFATNVFTNINQLLDFTIEVPTVNATNAWAGQNIGIEFLSTTEDPDLFGGVWDLDNVRLTSTVVVPNFSFETPVTEFVETNIDSWQDQPQSPFYDPVEFGGNPWDTLMGIFANTSPTNDDYLENMNGNQAAFVFNFPGTGFFQDYNSTDWSNTVPARAFNVTLDAGKSYTLTAAVTSSFDEPLTPGASLEMSLYYRDALSNMVALTANNIVFEANVFTNINYLTDFSATIPEVKSTDPWAGQTLGIQFICTTFDPDLIGGVWDLDNIRLTEKVATALNTPVTAKGQISFTLQSEPGLAFEILAATNLTAPPANWTNIATFTNLTGNFSLSDTTTNHQRFYKALQLP